MKQGKTGGRKGKAVPTRFGPLEIDLLDTLSAQTGFSRSELVRRAVRLLRLESAKRGDINFILTELAPKPGLLASDSRFNEPAAKYGK